jgi:hypothetical protein
MRSDFLIRQFVRVVFPLALFLVCAFPLAADTNLLNNGDWVVDGATDPGPDARDILVSVNGLPVGPFSELKVFHAFTGAGFPQVWSIKGNGALRPVLPPPGEFGGTFYLTQYWDCATGLTRSLVLVELNIQVDPKNPNDLLLTGKVSNLTSLEGTDFELRLNPPKNDSVKADVSYSLTATRDFCVNETRQDLLEGFRVARMVSNYISDNQNDNDSIRYASTVAKVCDCCDCYTIKGWVCAQLFDNDSYITCFEDKLADKRLFLVHNYPYPRITPTLVVHFDKPKPWHLNPQGFVTFTTDPNADNVDLWGNWRKAKDSYVAGRKVGKFKFTLEAREPDVLGCDAGACYY